jgi:hypothetical protein
MSQKCTSSGVGFIKFSEPLTGEHKQKIIAGIKTINKGFKAFGLMLNYTLPLIKSNDTGKDNSATLF